MLNRRLIIVIIFSIFSYSGSIMGEFIKIDKIDGTVLQDKSGNFQARSLVTGSKVNEGVIINSRKDSYARLRFHDNSTVVVGPDTNIKIESHKKKSATIIYLSKGLIRPKIEKDASTGEIEKFYILTPTGIVGVKGTEFLVHYNRENQRTSVITFKGAVNFAMVNLPRLRKERLYEDKKEKEVLRDDNNNVRLSNVARREVPSDKKLELALKKYSSVEVSAGQYSGTVNLIKRASLPILLSPIQLNILFRNANLKYLYTSKDYNKADTTLKKNKSDIPFDVPATSPSGIIDLSNKTYAPKAGGFWDMTSGFYIPPGKDSLFLKPAGIFVAKDIGDLDKLTGQYIPPLGMKMNPKQGFIKLPIKKGGPQDLRDRIDTDYERLQPSIHRQIITGDEDESFYTLGILSKRELISKDVISFHWRFVDHTLSMSNDTGASDRDYNSKNSMEYTLQWDHQASRKWQPTMAVVWQNLSFSEDELAGAPQDGEQLFKMRVGYRYSMSPDWNITLLGGLDQLYFLDHNATTAAGAGNNAMKRVTLPRFHLIFDSELFSKGRWSADITLAGMYSLARSPGNFDIDSGFGFRGEISTKYWWSRSWWLGLGIGRYIEKYGVANQNYTADADQKGSTFGLNLGMIL